MIEPLDMTLPELRAALGPLLPGHATFDGWAPPALDAAAIELGVPPERARIAFPEGAGQMIDAWFASVDEAMAAAFPPDRIAAMKVRERIRSLVWVRIAAVAPHREALRRALAILAFPTNLALGSKLGWRAADAMWRLAGDRSTDFAWYTKRLTLTGVYASTLLALLDDESENLADTAAFLDRRIEGVMRFEKLKAKLKPDPDNHFSPVRFLGRLRYPPA
ncbi:COQ9 family protein [Sphingomonas naphthae]|uniref:COQ9 family protein n=1 Tax=Sphingomonas naphthae TaxID=1813468 RepID=A0ABY7TIH3_9SPHN|nr:COQ9 family protein [Sphingomonas naphthae]WCT72980.1 COQ9 family protein [Sphingomonas naphthae]